LGRRKGGNSFTKKRVPISAVRPFLHLQVELLLKTPYVSPDGSLRPTHESGQRFLTWLAFVEPDAEVFQNPVKQLCAVRAERILSNFERDREEPFAGELTCF
jgi:hypothetical protein